MEFFNQLYFFLCRYVFSAPSHILDDIPGTLMLTDCLEQCQANDTCRAVNYETGLCVLFSSDADQLPGELHSLQLRKPGLDAILIGNQSSS